MRSFDEVAAVRRMVADGLSDAEISRRTAIPMSTIRGWRTGRTRSTTSGPGCARCNGPAHAVAALDSATYAYLLGQYLGDGHIARFPRTHRLQISYPSYFFSNESDDILLIFAAACQRVDVRYRWCRDTMIGVARRPDVARLDAFVGPKS